MNNHNDFCGRKVEATAVAVAGGAMTITVEPAGAYKNYEYYRLILGVALPSLTGAEPVDVTDGTTTWPLIDLCGQPVVSGKMRGHRIYALRYGAGGALSAGTIDPHFVVCKGLRCMAYSSNQALQDYDKVVTSNA